jgi:hypothetical protein
VVFSVFGVYGLALVVFSFVSIVMILRRKESSEFIDKIGKQSKIFTMVELTGSPLEKHDQSTSRWTTLLKRL